MNIGRLKKFLIWTIIAILFSGGVLGIFANPQKAKAATDYKALLENTCTISPKLAADQSGVITFGAINAASNKFNIYATVGSGSGKTYSFSFKNVDSTDPSGKVQFTYTYGADAPYAELFINSLYSGAVLIINEMGIVPNNGNNIHNWPNQEIKNLGIAFNARASADNFNRNFSSTCKHSNDFGSGNYPTSITFNGDQAPTIRIGASPDGTRKATIFTLKYVLNKTGAAPDDNLFMFQYSQNEDGSKKTEYSNIFIKLFEYGGNAYITECGDGGNYQSCVEDTSSKVNLNSSSLQLFWNHVYNSQGGGSSVCGAVTTYQSSNSSDGTKDKNLAAWTTKPDMQCLNTDTTGWLAKWGITVNDVSFTNPTGESSQWMMDCGLTTNIFSIVSPSWYVGQALCGIIQGLGYLAEWIVTGLFKSVFDAFQSPSLHLQNFASTISPLAIHQAHAATGEINSSSLTEALTVGSGSWGWVIKVWKFVLTLTDLFLVVILLFLGIVNIMHIQYDTYAIKKMLPLLIVGVILANFSLLIMRMLVDSSNILTHSFMGDSPGNMVHELITASKFSKATEHGFFTSFGNGWQAVGILLLGVIFAFFSTAAFLILGVMFYIRYAAVLLLAIAAPLAFIALAFPPTQSLFKQWWSWTIKFVYMKPIALFLIFIAIEVKGTESSVQSITAWMIIVFLVYMAIMVPWKLGGAIMSAWGGAMGSLFGTKKGGWARKPVDDYIQRRKDKIGADVKAALPGLFKGAEKDRQMVEASKKTADNRIKNRAMEGNNKLAQAKARAQVAEDKAKELEALHQLGINSGNYSENFGLKPLKGKRQYQSAMSLKADIHDTGARLQRALKGVSKDSDWGIFNVLGKDMEDANKLSERFEKEFNVLTEYKVEEDGKLKDTGNQTHYGNLKKLRDEMGMRYDTEENEDVKKNLLASMQKIDGITNSFESAHPDLPFNAYLNRNLNGRQLALLTPLLLDEAKTNSDNMSVEQFKQALFGNKGGGFGDVRYSDNGTPRDLIRQRYGARNHLEKEAGLAVLLGAVNRSVGQGIDAQEMLEMVLTGIDKGHSELKQDAYVPGYWKGKLGEIEQNRPGSCRAALKEYNKDAKSRGGIPIGITDFSQIESIDSMTTEEVLDRMPVEIIGKLNISDPKSREQRFIYNQVRSKVNNDPIFVRDRNPATRIGDISMPAENGSPQQGGGSRPAPIGPPQDPQAPLDLAQRLATATPDDMHQIIQQFGSATEAANYIYRPDSPLDVVSAIDSMRASLSQKLIPSDLEINLSDSAFDPLIERLSSLDIGVNMNHEQLSAELSKINPNFNLNLDTNIPVREYISQAQAVKRAGQNRDFILQEAAVEEVEPYAKTMASRTPEKLEEYLSNLNSTLSELTNAVEHTADQKSNGEITAVINPEAIARAVNATQEARGGDIDLNVDKYKNSPPELANMMRKLRVSIIGALNYHNDKSLQSTPDGLKIALRNAVKEGIMQTQTPPAAPGTAGTTGTPGAAAGEQTQASSNDHPETGAQGAGPGAPEA